MATNPAVPFWDEGNTITARATAAITGKRFVCISGARIDGHPAVNHAASSTTRKTFGVSAYDAASGADVMVHSAPGMVVPVTASVAITAGSNVYSAADGTATPTDPGTARVAGHALDDCAVGADAVIKLA